jgi:hypothetical protein
LLFANPQDSALFDAATWSRQRPSRVIAAVRLTARRFIDFDGTLTDEFGFPRQLLCGLPVTRLLAQEPFIIATWNPPAAAAHFDRFADLPRPLLIMSPPPTYFEFAEDVGKDFAALGITGALIIDDLAPRGLIHAPGCRVIGPLDALPCS